MKRELHSAVVTVSRIGGAVGAVLLATAPLTWVLTDAGSGADALVIAKLLSGIGLLAFWVTVNGRGLLSAPPDRGAPLVVLDVVNSGLVLVIVVAINVGVALRPSELDLTRERIHSLAPQTEELLARLASDVEIYAFYAPDEPELPSARERLARYAAASERLSVQLVDPIQRPDLVERFGIKRSGHRIVIRAGAAPPREVRLVNASEQALTNGLIEVAERPAQTIYFTTGHGEAAIDDDGPGGYRRAAEGLGGEGFAVATLRLLDTGTPPAVPPDAGVVVVAGARGTFLPAELLAIEEYLNRGGRLLVTLEPGMESGIASLLRQWKIEVHDDIIADSVSQMLGLGWSGPIIQTPPEPHPITADLVNAVVMRTARSLGLLAGGEARVEARALVQTGHSAWGETQLRDGEPARDDADLPGPLVVGIVATRDLGPGHSNHGHAYAPEHAGRLVAFGDTDWMNNRLAPQQGNLDLFLNSVAWLAQREEKITIRPRTRQNVPLALAPRDLGLLKFIAMDILPVLVIGLGVGVVLMRRRR